MALENPAFLPRSQLQECQPAAAWKIPDCTESLGVAVCVSHCGRLSEMTPHLGHLNTQFPVKAPWLIVHAALTERGPELASGIYKGQFTVACHTVPRDPTSSLTLYYMHKPTLRHIHAIKHKNEIFKHSQVRLEKQLRGLEHWLLFQEVLSSIPNIT